MPEPILEAISFTAARDLDDAGRAVVLNVLVQVPPALRYVTGAAIGGDAFIGRWLHENRPAAEHVVIVPADRGRVDEWWLEADGTNVTVIPMPQGTTYADRNARLVALGTAVYALPAYPEADPRSRRSGTWQAARMARRAGKLARWDCVKPPYAGRIEKWPSEFPHIAILTCRNCGATKPEPDGTPTDVAPSDHCGDCPPWRCDDCGRMCSAASLCPCWTSLDGMPLADIKALFAGDDELTIGGLGTGGADDA